MHVGTTKGYLPSSSLGRDVLFKVALGHVAIHVLLLSFLILHLVIFSSSKGWFILLLFLVGISLPNLLLEHFALAHHFLLVF